MSNLIFEQSAATDSIAKKVADFGLQFFKTCNFFKVIFENYFFPQLFTQQRSHSNSNLEQMSLSFQS